MYKIIIFDLDDTLTDDCENIRQAFKIVMDYRKEQYTPEKFERFYEIDKKTWSDRAKGILITPYEENKEKKAEWIRAYRFIKYFNNQITYQEGVKINNIYMEGLKENVVPQKGCYEIVKYLHEKGYKIIIATNGPIVPLNTKLDKLKITKFIDTVFSAEEVGFMKPHKEFYKGLYKKAKIKDSKGILFVGDELEKDIKGAIENNIDTCWCNYKKEINNKYKINYEINKLEDLKAIL